MRRDSVGLVVFVCACMCVCVFSFLKAISFFLSFSSFSSPLFFLYPCHLSQWPLAGTAGIAAAALAPCARQRERSVSTPSIPQSHTAAEREIAAICGRVSRRLKVREKKKEKEKLRRAKVKSVNAFSFFFGRYLPPYFFSLFIS